MSRFLCFKIWKFHQIISMFTSIPLSKKWPVSQSTLDEVHTCRNNCRIVNTMKGPNFKVLILCHWAIDHRPDDVHALHPHLQSLDCQARHWKVFDRNFLSKYSDSDLKQHLPVEVDLVEGAMPDEKWTVWAELIEHLLWIFNSSSDLNGESHTIHLNRQTVWADQESVDVYFFMKLQ